MLVWMQDSIWVSAGLTFALGLSSVGWAETPTLKTKPKPQPAAVTGRAAVDPAGIKIIRQPGQPFTILARKPAKTARNTARNVVRGQNEFEIPEPTVVAPIGVIPPPAPTQLVEGQLDEGQSEALKRLKDRSVKERWEQIHQEWLRNKKSREAQATPAKQADPASEQPADPAGSNPFETTPQVPPASDAEGAAPATAPEENLVPVEPGEATNPDATLTPAVPSGDGVTRPAVPADKLFLQSQQKPAEKLPTDEELTRMLNDDSGLRLPPPVRDPNAMPKISEIIPNPRPRADAVGSPTRPIPEQDAKRYVKLDREHAPYVPRAFPELTYSFEAANVWTNPLYFEDPHLERYGHTMHPVIQPIASTFLFALQVGGLPYQMAINHPKEKMYPLGWYLPGDNVPYRMRQIPLSLKGAAVETSVILGTQFATP